MKNWISVPFTPEDLKKNKTFIESAKPACFGEYPLRFPHIRAEYECDTCPFNHTCFETTPPK